MDCGEISVAAEALRPCREQLAFLQRGVKAQRELQSAVGGVVQQLRRRVAILQQECTQREALIKETWLALQHTQRRAHRKQWVTYSRLRSQASIIAPPTIRADKVQALQKLALDLRFEWNLTSELLRKVRCKLILAVFFGARLVSQARCDLANEALWHYKEPLLRPSFWALWRNVLRRRKKRAENGRPFASAHSFWQKHTLLRFICHWAAYARLSAVLKARSEKKKGETLTRSFQWWRARSRKRMQTQWALRKSWEWYSARTARVCLKGWHTVLWHRKHVVERLLMPVSHSRVRQAEENSWPETGDVGLPERGTSRGPTDDTLCNERPMIALHQEASSKSPVNPASTLEQCRPSHWAAALLRQIDASVTSQDQQIVESPFLKRSPDLLGPLEGANDGASISAKEQGRNPNGKGTLGKTEFSLKNACSVYYAKCLVGRAFRAWKGECGNARSKVQLARAFSEGSIAYTALCLWRRTCTDSLRVAHSHFRASLAKRSFLSWRKQVNKRAVLKEKLESALRGRRHHALSLALWGWQDWSVNKRKQRERIASIALDFLRQRLKLAFVCWRKEATRRKRKRSAEAMGRKAKLGTYWRHWAGGAKARVLLRRVFSEAEFRWAIAESLPSHHSEFHSAVRCLTAWHAFTVQQLIQRQEEVRISAADVYNRARLLTKAFQMLRGPVDDSRAQKAELLFRRKQLWVWRKWAARKRESPIAALQKRVQEVSGCRSVGEYSRRRVLRSVLLSWKRILNKKRTDSEAFWAVSLQRRALKVWRSIGDEIRERVAAYVRKWKRERKKSVLQHWRETVLERKERHRKEQIGRLKRDRRLKGTGLTAWKAYCQGRLQKQANRLIAQRHATSLLKLRAFRCWQRRLEWKRLKAQTAHHFEQRLKKLTWRALIRHTRESKVVRALTNGTSTRGTFKAVGSARNSPREAISPAIRNLPSAFAEKATSFVTQRGARSPTQAARDSKEGATALSNRTVARSSLSLARGSSERATRIAGGQVERSPKASPRFGLTKSRLGANEKRARSGQKCPPRGTSGKTGVGECGSKNVESRESTKSRTSSRESATRLKNDLPESPYSAAGDILESESATQRGSPSDFIPEDEQAQDGKQIATERNGHQQLLERSFRQPESPSAERSNETLTIEIDQQVEKKASANLEEAETNLQKLAGRSWSEDGERVLETPALSSADSPKLHQEHSGLSWSGGLEQLPVKCQDPLQSRLEDAGSRTKFQEHQHWVTADADRNGVSQEIEAEVLAHGLGKSRAVEKKGRSSEVERHCKRPEAAKRIETRGTGRAKSGALQGGPVWRAGDDGRETEFMPASWEQAKNEETAVQRRVRRSAVEVRPRRFSTVERAPKALQTRARRKSAGDANGSRVQKERNGWRRKRARAPQGLEVSPGRLAGGISPWAVEDNLWSPRNAFTLGDAPMIACRVRILSEAPSEAPSESEAESVALGRLVPSMAQKKQAEAPRDWKAAAEGWGKEVRLLEESFSLPTKSERRSLRSEDESLEDGRVSDVQKPDSANEKYKKVGEGGFNPALKVEKEEENLNSIPGRGVTQAVTSMRVNEEEEKTLRGGPELPVKRCWDEGESEVASEILSTLEGGAEKVTSEGRPEARQPDVIESSKLEETENNAEQTGRETDGENDWTGEGQKWTEGDSEKQEEAVKGREKATREGGEASRMAENTAEGRREADQRLYRDDKTEPQELSTEEQSKEDQKEGPERADSALWPGDDPALGLDSTIDVQRITSEANKIPATAGQACPVADAEARVVFNCEEVLVRRTAPVGVRAGTEDLSKDASRAEATSLVRRLGEVPEPKRIEDKGSGRVSNGCAALQEDAGAMLSSAGATNKLGFGKNRTIAVKMAACGAATCREGAISNDQGPIGRLFEQDEARESGSLATAAL